MDNIEKKEVVKEALKEAVATGQEISVILREDKPLIIHEDKKLEISGIITSPGDYIEQRPHECTKENSHAIVDQYAGTIVLTHLDRSDFSSTITGTIEVSKNVRELGINTMREYDPEGLAKALKLKRNYFESPAEHTTLIAALRNVTSKVNNEISQSKDDSANQTMKFNRTVDSNMPAAFNIKIPLIEGMEPVSISVNCVLEAKGGQHIVCYLESMDAADFIEKQFETLINIEVERIKPNTTVIRK